MRIVYLGSPRTMPGAPNRQADAFEHDRMMETLHVGSHGGASVIDASWDAPMAWEDFNAVLIGTTWDYWDRYDQFIHTLQDIANRTALFNPVSLVRWNSHKSYLRDLADWGVPSIPTRWIDRIDPTSVSALFNDLGDHLVFKRQVGAGAYGQHRLRRGDDVPAMPHPMLVQPFLPSIQDEGEYSFVFVDGTLSHALIKRPAAGDYRIQSLYGGSEESYRPTGSDISAATSVILGLSEVPLYARVDMIRHEGTLRLMELELVEPYLYPEQGPQLGTRLIEAVQRRVE